MECCGKYENTLLTRHSLRVRSEKFANIFLKSMFRLPTERTYFCRVQTGRHAITRTFGKHHNIHSEKMSDFQYRKRFFMPKTILVTMSILSDQYKCINNILDVREVAFLCAWCGNSERSSGEIHLLARFTTRSVDTR